MIGPPPTHRFQRHLTGGRFAMTMTYCVFNGEENVLYYMGGEYVDRKSARALRSCCECTSVSTSCTSSFQPRISPCPWRPDPRTWTCRPTWPTSLPTPCQPRVP